MQLLLEIGDRMRDRRVVVGDCALDTGARPDPDGVHGVVRRDEQREGLLRSRGEDRDGAGLGKARQPGEVAVLAKGEVGVGAPDLLGGGRQQHHASSHGFHHACPTGGEQGAILGAERHRSHL